MEQPVSKRAVGNWDDAYTKATASLAKLSQAEKIGMVTGVGWTNGPCVGNTKAASSIGYPSLCLQGRFSSSPFFEILKFRHVDVSKYARNNPTGL